MEFIFTNTGYLEFGYDAYSHPTITSEREYESDIVYVKAADILEKLQAIQDMLDEGDEEERQYDYFYQVAGELRSLVEELDGKVDTYGWIWSSKHDSDS